MAVWCWRRLTVEVRDGSKEAVWRTEGTASPPHSLLLHCVSSQLEHKLPERDLFFCLFVCLWLCLQCLGQFMTHAIFVEWMIQILQMSSSKMTAFSGLYLLWWNLTALCVVYIPAEMLLCSNLNQFSLLVHFYVGVLQPPQGQEDIISQSERLKWWEVWLDFPSGASILHWNSRTMSGWKRPL